MVSTVVTYVESQLGVPYLDFSILNPKPDQIVPAGALLSIEVVNYTCADRAITCSIDYPKLGKYKVRYVTFGFWFRDDRLTLINVENMGKIV